MKMYKRKIIDDIILAVISIAVIAFVISLDSPDTLTRIKIEYMLITVPLAGVSVAFIAKAYYTYKKYRGRKVRRNL